MSRLLPSLAAAVLLVGCSMPNGSVAAKVGDVTIKESQVNAVASGCSGLVQASKNELQRDVVQELVRGAMSEQLAAKHGIDISPGQQDALLRQAAPNVLALKANDQCAEVASAMAKFQLVLTSLGEQTLVNDGLAIDININPRYGNWNPAAWQLTGSGSLSQPASGLR